MNRHLKSLCVLICLLQALACQDEDGGEGGSGDGALSPKEPRKLGWDFPLPTPARQTPLKKTSASKDKKVKGQEARMTPNSKPKPFPYLGMTYEISNSPYEKTILVPYLEPENASKGTTVDAHVIIAQDKKMSKAVRMRKLRAAPVLEQQNINKFNI